MHKVLVIASDEHARSFCFVLAEALKSFGYSAEFTHALTEGSDIAPDRKLEAGLSITDFEGVVVLDDGGDHAAASDIVKRAAEADLPIGGAGAGLTVLAQAGIFAEKHLCAGMPDEFYEGANKVEAKTVKTEGLVTSMAGHPEEFCYMFLDLLGKIKKIVRSLNDDKVLEDKEARSGICDVQSHVFDPESIGIAVELACSTGDRFLRTNGLALRLSGRGDSAIVSCRGPKGPQHLIERKVDLEKRFSSIGRFIVQDNIPSTHVGDMAFDLKAHVKKQNGEWIVASLTAVGGHVFAGSDSNIECPASEIIVAAGLSSEVLEKANSTAIRGAVLAQAFSEEINAVRVFMSMSESPLIIDVDKGVPDHYASSRMVMASRKTNPDTHKLLLERELAHCGIWMQPNGQVAVTLDGTPQRMTFQEAKDVLQENVSKITEEEIKANRAGDGSKVKTRSRMARHKLMMLMALWRATSPVTTDKAAGLYPSGVQGPMSNLDLPMFERVFEWRDGDDFLDDRGKEQAIGQEKTRYRPEYDKTNPDDAIGFFYTWFDEQRFPYLYDRSGTEGTYPSRDVLRQN